MFRVVRRLWHHLTLAREGGRERLLPGAGFLRDDESGGTHLQSQTLSPYVVVFPVLLARTIRGNDVDANEAFFDFAASSREGFSSFSHFPKSFFVALLLTGTFFVDDEPKCYCAFALFCRLL